MQRQQIQPRQIFDDIDRHKIWEKSDGYCAHCGKRIEFGGQATIDHFVPLSKGGVNADYNIVMLCHDCNQEKGNLIYKPEGYLKFLHESDLDKLSGYFHDSYAHSFEFFHSHNILAADVLCYQAMPFAAPDPRLQIKKGKHKAVYTSSYTIELKRAFKEDKEKINNFVREYLDHYSYPDIDAEKLVKLWFDFGTIYYMEQTDGMKLLFGVMLGSVDRGILGLQVFCLSKYSKAKYIQMAHFFLAHITQDLMDEQNMIVIPTVVYVLNNDPFKALFSSASSFDPIGPVAGGLLEGSYYIAYSEQAADMSSTERKNEAKKVSKALKALCMPEDTIDSYIRNELKLPALAYELIPPLLHLYE